MTSTPTKAMLAAAAGNAYRISYGGRFGFQYADDTARAYIDAARVGFKGAEVFNLGGETVSMRDVVDAIEKAAPGSKGSITYDEVPLPFPAEIDNAPLVRVLGALHVTPLVKGVADSIRVFREALAEGRIAAADISSLLG
jgi:nucleoside-diphosphate-sugar epimerase